MSYEFIEMNRPGFLNRPVNHHLTESLYELFGEMLLSEDRNRYGYRKGFDLKGVQNKLKTLTAHIIADGMSKSGKSGTPYRDARAILWRYLAEKFPEDVNRTQIYPMAKHVNAVVGALDTAGKITDEIYQGFGPWLEQNFTETAAAIATRITGTDITPEYVSEALGDTSRGAEKVDDDIEDVANEIPPEEKMGRSLEGSNEYVNKILTTGIANGQSIKDYIGSGSTEVSVWGPDRGELEFTLNIPKNSRKSLEISNLNDQQIVDLGETLISLLKKAGLIEGGEILIYKADSQEDNRIRIDFDLRIPVQASETTPPTEEDQVNNEEPYQDFSDENEELEINDYYGMKSEKSNCNCQYAKDGCCCEGCEDCKSNSDQTQYKLSPQAMNEKMKMDFLQRRQKMFSQEIKYKKGY